MTTLKPGANRFLLVKRDALLHMLSQLERGGKLRHADATTVLHLASLLSSSNVIHGYLQALAKDRGVTRQSYGESIDRLKAAGLVVRGINQRTGGAFYMLHPDLAAYGDAKQRAVAWKRFEALLSAQEDNDYAKAEARSRQREIAANMVVALDGRKRSPTLEGIPSPLEAA